MSYQLGFAPITWNNEDLKDLRPPVPYQTVLDEVAAAGYEGTELGDGFSGDPDEMRQALEARGLELPSGWCGLELIGDETRDRDLGHARRICGYLADAGATFVNLANQGPAERRAVAGRAADPEAPHLSQDEWDRLAERVSRAAEIARVAGLQALFHQHVGTWVETIDDLLQLLRRTDGSLLKLCWDVGHAVYAGIDPLEVIRRYPGRIAYIHLKDVDATVLDSVRAERLGFLDGVRRCVFTELGRGLLDVPALLETLDGIGYDGWLMVEQDSTRLEPIESARTSREYLRSLGV